MSSTPKIPYRDIASDREKENLSRLVDYSSVNSLPEIWPITAEKFGSIVALHDPHSTPEVQLTYAQLYEQIQHFAAGLQALGIQPEDKVALFSDNSPRWFIADQGIMTAGATNAVRSSQADRSELLYILENSDSKTLVVQDEATLNKLRPEIHNLPIERVILLSDETFAEDSLRALNFSEFLQLGSQSSLTPVQQTPDTLATLLYTSGTTGKPKGVMLTHANLLYQVNMLGTILPAQPGDRVLSILPSWHAYERSAEYFLLSQGCTQIYTNLRSFKKDIKDLKPHYMVGVPRLWESIYDGVQKQFQEQPASKQRMIKFFLGISESYIINQRIAQGLSLEPISPSSSERLAAKLKAIFLAPLHALGDRLVYTKVRQATGGQMKSVISGGGSLARHIDRFYSMIGIQLLVGYGLTETSPVTNARRTWHNVVGASGQPLAGTEVRIVDPESRRDLPPKERGLVLVRGPQIMKGYYKLPEATAKAIDADGWFNTGDLGMVTPKNDLVITGRAKDTIVLSNGENIEPQPLEDACVRSPYIDQIMVVGQDQRSLGALIVPNFDNLQTWLQGKSITLSLDDAEALNNHSAIRDLFRQELTREVKDRPGYRPDDRIGTFRLITEQFSIEKGTMTQTLKIKRPVVAERYQDIINGMFQK